MTVRLISPDEAERLLPVFSALLVDAVASGASVNFMAGFRLDEAETYWRRQIAAFRSGDRLWLIAEQNGTVAGMVMCVFATQPNQPFRAEVSKMLVHSSMRRQGIGGALMRAVETAALEAGRTHLILDTATGEDGDRLYRRMGWTEVGTLDGFAYRPDGSLAAATIFMKKLAEPPPYRGGVR